MVEERLRLFDLSMLQQLLVIRRVFRNWAVCVISLKLIGRLARRLIVNHLPLDLYERFFDHPVTLRTRTNLCVTARLRDLHGPIEVFVAGDYAFDEIDWSQVAYVIDAGAHVGSFTLWATQRSPCRVAAIEPNPEVYQLLQQNIARANLSDRVTLSNIALAGAHGTAELRVSLFSPDANIVLEQGEGRSFPVKTETLQRLIEQLGVGYVDLLKLDIEGGEYAVLQSLPERYLRRVGILLMECHPRPGADPFALCELLRRSGMEVAAYEKQLGLVEVFASRPGQSAVVKAIH